MGLEAPRVLFASQPLEGNFRITLNAPFPSSHVQQPTGYLKNTSSHVQRELLSSCPTIIHVHIGPSGSPCCLSLFSPNGVATSAFQTRDQHWITSVHRCLPLLSCSLAFRWSSVRSPKGWANWAPKLLPSSSKKLLLLYDLYFGSWFHWKGSMFVKQTSLQSTGHKIKPDFLIMTWKVFYRKSHPIQEPHLLPFLPVTSAPSLHQGHDLWYVRVPTLLVGYTFLHLPP